jgi:hypothetical protein
LRCRAPVHLSRSITKDWGSITQHWDSITQHFGHCQPASYVIATTPGQHHTAYSRQNQTASHSSTQHHIAYPRQIRTIPDKRHEGKHQRAKESEPGPGGHTSESAIAGSGRGQIPVGEERYCHPRASSNNSTNHTIPTNSYCYPNHPCESYEFYEPSYPSDLPNLTSMNFI